MLLNQLRAGNIFARCTVQQGYKICIHVLSQRTAKQYALYMTRTDDDGQIWHQKVEEFGNSISHF